MKGEIVVIKFGGEIVENESDLENLVLATKKFHEDGMKVVLVHGGGPFASKLSKKMGLSPEMVGGRRVTCSETLDIMKMSLPGLVNSNVLAMFKKHGLPAVPASSINFIDCHKRPPKVVSGSDGQKVDFGFVGDVDECHPDLLRTLVDANYIPVVSPLSCDAEGQLLNINADTIAVQVADGLSASRFVLVTKIGGVFRNIDDPSSKIQRLSVAEAKQLILEEVIVGGMIPKLEESFQLIERGLSSFHIVGIPTAQTIVHELTTPGSEGTVIMA